MSTFFMAAWFLLFGVMNLAETKIPVWVLGALAVLVAMSLLFDGWRNRAKP